MAKYEPKEVDITISVDDEVIHRASHRAEVLGTSVNQLVQSLVTPHRALHSSHASRIALRQYIAGIQIRKRNCDKAR